MFVVIVGDNQSGLVGTSGRTRRYLTVDQALNLKTAVGLNLSEGQFVGIGLAAQFQRVARKVERAGLLQDDSANCRRLSG